MPLFAVIGRDGPQGPQGRKLHREAHLANLQTLVDRGRVRYAGPTVDAQGGPTGSLIVLEAEDLEAARAVVAADPYVTQGVFDSFEVTETKQVFGAIGAIEAMESCRAIRYLRPDPVPEELIERVLHAATRASSPGNSQGWEFVVVTDADTRRRLRDAAGAAMAGVVEGMRASLSSARERRMLDGAVHLGANLDQVPVIIVVCGHKAYPPQEPDESSVWSSVYPASQNLIVAARALGLGTTFTTMHMLAEKQVREILGIPDDVYIGTMIPMGYPDRPFGPLARRPLAEVVHRDRWQVRF